MTHYDITIGSDVARYVYFDIIMGQDVVMDTCHDVLSGDRLASSPMEGNHDVTMHTDVAVILIYYVLLRPSMMFLFS